MITWFKNWQRARRERKIFEALFLLALMDDNQACACKGDLELCDCDNGPDCD